MFKIGNHTFDELLMGTAFNIANGGILWTANQFRNASVEISADSTDITDKNGNVVLTRYNSKSGTFNSTHAFLHPAIMNAQSGSDIITATEAKPQDMPFMGTVAAGGTLDVTAAKEGTIKVIGIYGNGANSPVLTQDTEADLDTWKFGLKTEDSKTILSVPASGVDAPVEYQVVYDYSEKSGIILMNTAGTYPQTVNFKLLCSYVDICTKETKPAIVELPSFTPDPSMTLNFDRDTQDVDFNGTLSIDYCSALKTLYKIYYPDQNLVISGAGN